MYPDSNIFLFKKIDRWKNEKSKIIAKYKQCVFCGGHYDTYYVYPNFHKIKQLVTYCVICYHITHLNIAPTEQLKLFYSKMDQAEIIKKTVIFYENNEAIPKPYEIDPDVKKINISSFEYANVLIDYNVQDLPKEMLNYKIFIDEDYDMTFICYPMNDYMLSEEDSDFISEYQMSDSEINFIKNHFYTDVFDIMQYNIEAIEEIKNINSVRNDNADRQFNLIKNIHMSFPPF